MVSIFSATSLIAFTLLVAAAAKAESFVVDASLADANFLYDYAEKLFKEKGLKQGGLGSYKANAVHGPFVHVDARGRPA